MFSAFNPSKCTHLEPAVRRPGSSRGLPARRQDSNPQPWVTRGFKANALSIRPRLPKFYCYLLPVLVSYLNYFYQCIFQYFRIIVNQN